MDEYFKGLTDWWSDFGKVFSSNTSPSSLPLGGGFTYNLANYNTSLYSDWQNNLSNLFGDAYKSVAMPNSGMQLILNQTQPHSDENANKIFETQGEEAGYKYLNERKNVGFSKDLMAANSAYSLMGLQQGEAAYNQTQLLDPLSKNNINAFTDAADTGFMANGGMVAKRTLTKADGGIAGGEFIQSEKGEVVMLPDGTIVKTGATKTHKKMKSEGDSDKITDALPEGSIVFPSDKKFTLKKKDFEGIAINVTTPEYKEGETPQDPEITYFTDLFTKDKNTPAELILQLSKMIPVTQRGEGLINGDDPITNNTNAKNLQARMPWVEQVLSTFPKGQEILGGQNEGATEGTTDGAIEGEETEQFAEGGIITEDMKKNAKASVSKYFDPTLNPTIAEIQKQNPAAFNRFVKDLKANPPKIVEFNSDKDNRLGYYEPAEQDKKTWKPKDGGTLYINTNKTLRDKTQESIEGTIAHELGHQGTWFNKALQVHNMQAAKKVYGDDMTKIANVDEDAAHVRMIKMNSGDIGKKNYSTKDVDRLIKEDSNDIRYLMKSLNNDKEKVATYLNELVVNSTKDNSTKYAKDGGMITEYKEGGIVGYEPKKALVGTLIAGAIGLGASAFNAYYTNQQLNKMQREAEKLKNKEMQAAGVMAGVQGASLLAQDTKVDTARDNPLYQLQESYLNQMPTEIPQWQVQNYYQELDKTARQNDEWYNNITDPYTRAALMDDSKTLEAKNKAMMQVADTNLKLQQGALDAKYKHYGATLADEVAAANQMRGNTNAVMQGLGQTMVDYEQNKLAAERGLTNAKTQVLSGKASNISNLTNNVANLGMAAGSSIDAAKMQTDQMNLMRDLYGNKNTTTGFTPDPNIGKSFSGVTNMELPPVKFTPQLNSTQPSFMTNETQLDALTAIFGDRRMAEIMLDIYKKSNKKETNPENIYNSYMENN